VAGAGFAVVSSRQTLTPRKRVGGIVPVRLALPASILSMLGGAAFIATLLAVQARGFDWTDEGYYLNVIASPWSFPTSVTLFGFVYHPLYVIADGDLILLRRLNLGLTLGPAAILAGLMATGVSSARAGSVQRGRQGWIALPVASLVLVFYRLPPSPSYNSLNLQALLIVAIALVLLLRHAWERSTGWVLLALGVALCFLAKPTSALALGPLLMAFLLGSRWPRKPPLRGIVLCALTLATALILAATLIDGSPAAFMQRLAAGRQEVQLLNAGQSVSVFHFVARLQPTGSPKSLLLMTALAGSVALLVWRATRGEPFRGRTAAWMLAILVIALCAALLCLWGLVTPAPRLRRLEAGLPAVPVGICIGALPAVRSTWRDSREALCLAALFLALPFVYAFGTNMDVWLTTGNAAYFWLLPALLVLKKQVDRLMYVLAMQVLVVMAVALYLQYPYRQSEPILATRTRVAIPLHGGAALYLTADAADYARGLAQLAEREELRPRTPLLDLTGHSPGTQYFLGSKPVGSAWIIGGFAGSEAYARAVLARVACDELAGAWVLIETLGYRALPETLLAAHGILLAESYEPVGALVAPVRSRPVRAEQVLYRPARSAPDAAAACRAARALHRQ
jgi:hypothetical protein